MGVESVMRELFKDKNGSVPAKAEESDGVEAPDKAGMNTTRGMLAGVTLIRKNGDLVAISYGAIHCVKYDKAVGIIFKFAEVDQSVFEVTIHGNNLSGLHRDLQLCRRETVRINGETVMDIEINACK